MNQTLIGYISDSKKLKEHIVVESSNYIQIVQQKVIIFNQNDLEFDIKNDKRFKSISYKMVASIKMKNLYVANKRDQELPVVLKETIPNLKDCLIVINGVIDIELFEFLLSFQKSNNIDYLFNNDLIFNQNTSKILNPEKNYITAFSVINFTPLIENDFNTLKQNLGDLDGIGIFIVCELSRLHYEKQLELDKSKKYVKPIYYFNNSMSINESVFNNFINKILETNSFIKFSSDELKEMYRVNE